MANKNKGLFICSVCGYAIGWYLYPKSISQVCQFCERVIDRLNADPAVKKATMAKIRKLSIADRASAILRGAI